MTWLDNRTLAHLRDVADWPDLGERYEVTGRLGRGGMGAVYAAHDRVLDREVAVKVVDNGVGHGDAARLVDEARILGRLEHPGIVPVHDAGTLADGRVFYVMKQVRGERLDAALRSRSLNDRLDLFLRVCDAVSFAHARGVVHRDLKPDNIMLGAFGEVLVMDWGLADYSPHARHAADRDGVVRVGQGSEVLRGHEALSVSRHDHRQPAEHPAERGDGSGLGTIGGTPGFMAPEQQRGDSHVDQRADVFSLGVILGLLMPDQAPKSLRAIAARASAPDLHLRYGTVKDLARDITRFRDGDPVSAYQETPVERLARLYRRYQLPILLVLAYVIMRLVLLLWRGV